MCIVYVRCVGFVCVCAQPVLVTDAVRELARDVTAATHGV